jgi:nitrite reductase/ring-hydroxylating ferredoxin subunit
LQMDELHLRRSFALQASILLILRATTMADFVEVARLDQIQPATGSRFNVVGKEVAVFNVDGSLYAIADTCPHAGGRWEWESSTARSLFARSTG